eukprot:scaffold23556_cov111-Skeletonema_dohrnii-CCMP3373.AAC.3
MYAPAVDLPHNLHGRLFQYHDGAVSELDISELSQSYLRAVSELSQSYLRAISELSQSCLRAVSELSQSCLRAVSELSQSCSERNMECLGVSQSQGGVSWSVTWSGVE